MRFFIKCFMGIVFAYTFSLAACDCCDSVPESFLKTTTGTITVATDNAGNPVEIAYKAVGKNDGRPVILFCDPYLGIDSWNIQQKVFGIEYYTIAYDPVGFGLSSKNDPTDLDGVNGQTGYSFHQQATFAHELVKQLDIQGPLIWMGVDIRAQVGIWYATDYADDQYAITKMGMEDSSADSIVSDDPCSLAYLTVEQAQQLIGLFEQDPVQGATALLGPSFKTTQCPSIQGVITELAANYTATTTPAIFQRLLSGTLTEDVSGLMANINIPVFNTYGTTGDIHPVSRRGVGITLVGKTTGWTNPVVYSVTGNVCTNCGTTVDPFPNSRLFTYPGHGTIVHVTSCARFNRQLRSFITGQEAECSICLPMGGQTGSPEEEQL